MKKKVDLRGNGKEISLLLVSTTTKMLVVRLQRWRGINWNHLDIIKDQRKAPTKTTSTSTNFPICRLIHLAELLPMQQEKENGGWKVEWQQLLAGLCQTDNVNCIYKFGVWIYINELCDYFLKCELYLHNFYYIHNPTQNKLVNQITHLLPM